MNPQSRVGASSWRRREKQSPGAPGARLSSASARLPSPLPDDSPPLLRLALPIASSCARSALAIWSGERERKQGSRTLSSRATAVVFESRSFSSDASQRVKITAKLLISTIKLIRCLFWRLVPSIHYPSYPRLQQSLCQFLISSKLIHESSALSSLDSGV